MNISKLIESLEEFKANHGDLDITVWADHGQDTTLAEMLSIQYLDSDGESCHIDDIDAEDLDQYNKTLEIS